MQYRTVGNTDLRVSEVGFGTGGTAGLMVQGSFEQQLGAVERAIELGINYFDVSPDYGDGVSETNLGKVLRELGVRPVICTKVEVREANLGDVASHVERSVEASLQRLGVDYVDIVQIHNGPTVERPNIQGRDYRVLGLEDYLGRNGALEGLERVKRTGKTRYIGFICRGNDGGPVRELIDTGLFSLINVIYTLMNPTAVIPPYRGMAVEPNWGQVIPYAHAHGVGAAIYSPLSGGLLTDHIVGGGEPHPLANAGREGGPRAWEQRKRGVARSGKFGFLSTGSDGQSLAQAAIRFILAEPGVSVALGGFSDISQLEEVAGASGVGPLTPAEMARVEMVWRANFGASQ